MTAIFNHVTYLKCGYEEENLSTARKCEIFGQPLNKNKSVTPIIAGVESTVSLGALGFTGYNAFSCKNASQPVPQVTIIEENGHAEMKRL